VVTIPDGTTPGESRVKVDVGAYFVIALVPKWAEVGKRMDLVETTGENWECQASNGYSDAAIPAKAELVLPRYDIRVPPDATPGLTQLEVDLGIGQALMVTVPPQALPGDRLSLGFDEIAKEWRMTIVRNVV